MAWMTLVLAGLFEVAWAYCMKISDGFTKPWPTVLMAISMLCSFSLLAWAMRSIPLGTAYTIWTGIGAVGAFIVGITALGEPANLMRVVAAGFIVSGLLLMKFASAS